ncbi:MAG: sigma-70 family RNA polymerase sigma factor, partial [Clostridia bacterium]|nr:sigma-70 family RNA polymerase sigma factor [Clostridia bacterium]
DAVQTLPVQDRYAVYLYYYEGYGVKEIGHLLKEPEGTVSSRLSRARKKLKTILEGGNHGRQIQQRL